MTTPNPLTEITSDDIMCPVGTDIEVLGEVESIDSHSEDEPELITTLPIQPSNFHLHLWKNLFIDFEASIFYLQNHLSPPRAEHEELRTRSEPIIFSQESESIKFLKEPSLQESIDIVICLLPWSEMGDYNAINYPDNVQRSGKIFIHFPIHPRSLCNHHHIQKSKCRQTPCGRFSPFLDMRAVTTMINRYMENGSSVLIYCHRDYQRMLLFVACCMVQAGVLVTDVLELMNRYELQTRYQKYIKAYSDYIRQIK
jgi:hypothetical protein